MHVRGVLVDGQKWWNVIRYTYSTTVLTGAICKNWPTVEFTIKTGRAYKPCNRQL